MLTLLAGLAMAGPPDPAEIDVVLDTLHRAAAEADAETYFGLFADDAVFIGTDASERWDMAAFRAFAEPHFAEAPAWVYRSTGREVHLGPKGRVAWFYETLESERYGAARGSGVLRHDRDGWTLTQYVLSFPIPNDRARGVLDLVAGRARLPTPFTAGQIRAVYQPGFTSTFRYLEGDVDVRRRATVVAADADGVTLRTEVLDAGDQVVGEPTEARHAWTELRDHAAFPAGSTQVLPDEEITVPYGTIEVRRYVVEADDGAVRTFWFAPELPGPPVRMTVAVAGETVFLMELLQRAGGRTPR